MKVRNQSRWTTLKFFNDEFSSAWWISAFVALMAAFSNAFTVVNTKAGPSNFRSELTLPLLMMGLSFLAASIGIIESQFRALALRLRELTKGLWINPLAAWWIALILVRIEVPRMEALAHASRLPLESACGAVIILALVFQGPAATFYTVFSAAAGWIAYHLSSEPVVDPSFQTRDMVLAALSFPMAFAIFSLRMTRTSRSFHLVRLTLAREKLFHFRSQISILSDSTEMAREGLLGPSTDRSVSEVLGLSANHRGTGHAEEPLSSSYTIDRLVDELRQRMAHFQGKARAGGRGDWLRFVFFPPVTGTDGSQRVVGEIDPLLTGIDGCLELALAALPELTSRRTGVIRLSIRVGLRVLEIAIEDNGRGTLGAVGRAELAEEIVSLRRFVQSLGGRVERMARLGVGARTTIELPLLPTSIRSNARSLNLDESQSRTPEISPAQVGQ